MKPLVLLPLLFALQAWAVPCSQNDPGADSGADSGPGAMWGNLEGPGNTGNQPATPTINSTASPGANTPPQPQPTGTGNSTGPSTTGFVDMCTITCIAETIRCQMWSGMIPWRLLLKAYSPRRLIAWVQTIYCKFTWKDSNSLAKGGKKEGLELFGPVMLTAR